MFWDDFVILDRDVDYFVTARLFDGTPAVWPEELSYVRWRHRVAIHLGVDPMSVQLVGSARLGYSMNPRKGYKRFNSESDLDIAVVSSELFDTAWTELRTIISNARFETQRKYLRKLVFEECIALDIILPHLSFGEHWSLARDSLVEHLGPDLQRCDVNYRLYRSHRSLRKYHAESVSTARDRAIEEGIADA